MHGRLVLGISCRILTSTDLLLKLVRDHKRARQMWELFCSGRQRSSDLVPLEPREIKKQVRKAEQQRFLQDHTNKPHHGVFFRNIEEIGLSRKLTFAFLSSADLKSETEGFLLECQDGVINTLVYRSQFSNVDDNRCRACRQQRETLMHIL
ncbi:hypothetical protein NQ315_015229 [Exocentrus adspersus]|uniref:Uncharacterized protein n=1 Tax=Exocentrus adspersus TaxID=1586481 RepID=A0AAV8VWT3_9CUCU|nr:hypothetical protein NQ315_015229 [Exocentrus adspersus]